MRCRECAAGETRRCVWRAADKALEEKRRAARTDDETPVAQLGRVDRQLGPSLVPTLGLWFLLVVGGVRSGLLTHCSCHGSYTKRKLRRGDLLASNCNCSAASNHCHTARARRPVHALRISTPRAPLHCPTPTMGQFMRGSSRGARTAWLGKVTVKAILDDVNFYEKGIGRQAQTSAYPTSQACCEPCCAPRGYLCEIARYARRIALVCSAPLCRRVFNNSKVCLPGMC